MLQINPLTISDNEKIVCDFYLANNTKVASYRLLRKLNGEIRQLTDAGIKSAAQTFFSKEYVQKYIQYKEKELYAKYSDKDVVKNMPQGANIDLSTAPKSVVNKFLIEKLESVIQDPNSTSADIISATNKIADIRDSKEKADKTEMSEYEKTVHFCLPADLCENCPNKEKIYAEYGFPASEEEIRTAFYKNKNNKLDE